MEPAAGPDHLSSCPNKLAAGARSGPVFTTAAVSGGGGEGGGGHFHIMEANQVCTEKTSFGI